ncbi:Hsp70 family protein-like protein [Pleurostoma richardsiae]|uniref:Hsp70 family protein-like protein n=1 Tax=Pleurostoma richardsiae TaxID=41990 RepID=A0AA38VHK3_9PEZI|nr:Hsp70 family protein-like protein [Pleurostoma richardsiae]
MKMEVPSEVLYPLDRRFREMEDLSHDERNHEDASDDVQDARTSIQSDDHEDMDEDEDMFDAEMMDDTVSFRWGYGVHEALGYPELHSDANNRPLARFKLLLDNSPKTDKIREDLNETIKTLCKKRIIKAPPAVDIIADYLTCLFRHVKDELGEEGFDGNHSLEIVLCVPAIWTSKACREMQAAVAKAMSRARIQGVDIQNKSIENLFLVSEPEAAAAYVLELNREIIPGDTFVLLDAGGGTVDATTFTVTQTTPLRLSEEVVEPSGGLHGSSFINEAFRKHLRELIKEERYLEQGLETLDGIVEKYMIAEFEYKIKRNFDYTVANGRKRVQIPYLRDNPERGISRSSFWIPMSKIKEMFLDCLRGVAKVMEEQIDGARRKGVRVDKVILVGGFAASPSLKKFLERRLRDYSENNNCRISLISPSDTTTAVASGAVLRALNKENGPSRKARSSYGILRTEPYGEYPEHKGPVYNDPQDGLRYIKDTIDWKLIKGQEVGSVWESPRFSCTHTIAAWPPSRLLCKEVFYVSDEATKFHYRKSDQENKSAEVAGDIVVDFTFLREQGLIQPVEPEPGTKGKRHYKVNYDILIRIVDRDLKCYAIYDNEVVKQCRINIASAFRAGVK